MTLEEAIELAEQGDTEMMCSLAKYYYDNSEYSEAKNWYCRAAEGGYTPAYLPAALITSMLSTATRHISGGSSIYDQDVYELRRALTWAESAKASGFDVDATSIEMIKHDCGLCAYYASKKPNSSITSDAVISYLMDAYKTESHTPEVEVFLAFAMYETDNLSSSDESFCFNLLRQCSMYTENDVRDINLGIIDAYLGCCYLQGKGCSIDDNAAYECFVRAGNKGFDCSDMLSGFRKKMFGGYVYKR